MPEVSKSSVDVFSALVTVQGRIVSVCEERAAINNTVLPVWADLLSPGNTALFHYSTVWRKMREGRRNRQIDRRGTREDESEQFK